MLRILLHHYTRWKQLGSLSTSGGPDWWKSRLIARWNQRLLSLPYKDVELCCWGMSIRLLILIRHRGFRIKEKRPSLHVSLTQLTWKGFIYQTLLLQLRWSHLNSLLKIPKSPCYRSSKASLWKLDTILKLLKLDFYLAHWFYFYLQFDFGLTVKSWLCFIGVKWINLPLKHTGINRSSDLKSLVDF